MSQKNPSVPIRATSSDTMDQDKALADASDLPSVINALPRIYQPALGKLLQDTYRIAIKSAGVQSTLTAWKRHKTEGTVPPQIKGQVRDSKVQFSKEYRGNTAGKDAEIRMENQVKEARNSILAASIAEKEKELALLASQTSFSDSAWQATVKQTAGDALVGLGGSVDHGERGVVRFKNAPSAFIAEYTRAHDDGKKFHDRVVELAFASVAKQTVSKQKKVEVKKDTDVTMTGTDTEKSVEDLVNEKTLQLRRDLESMKKMLSQKRNQKGNKSSRPSKKPNAGVGKGRGSKAPQKGKGKKPSR